MNWYKKIYNLISFLSKKNTSSIWLSNASATILANFSEGLYVHFSRKTIVSLLTHTMFARSSWVRLCLALSSFILVCMKNNHKDKYKNYFWVVSQGTSGIGKSGCPCCIRCPFLQTRLSSHDRMRSDATIAIPSRMAIRKNLLSNLVFLFI